MNPMRRSTFSGLAAVAVFGAACAGGSIRPSYAPFEGARVDTVNAGPAAVIQEIVARVTAERMSPQFSSPAEGYMETQWYDVVEQKSGAFDRSAPDHFILLRFWADSIGEGKSRVTSEAVYKRTTDPSVLPRDQEMLVPPGHAGDRMLRAVMTSVKQRFGG
jgi:hypothetical protein